LLRRTDGGIHHKDIYHTRMAVPDGVIQGGNLCHVILGIHVYKKENYEIEQGQLIK
jgi:hypothetical protein